MENNSKLIEALEAVQRELNPKPEAKEEAPKYATSEELNAVKEEIIALLSAQNTDGDGDDCDESDCEDDGQTAAGEPTDVKPPVHGIQEQDEKLSEDVVEENEEVEEVVEETISEELSEEEIVTHSPEAQNEKLSGFKWGTKRPERMLDRILTKLYA